MESVPVDAVHLWAALSVASIAAVAAALAVTGQPPPDATAVAELVDRVAASPTPTAAGTPVAATAVRIGPRRLALRNDAGTTAATVAGAPMTPVAGGALGRLLAGEPPAAVFDSPRALRDAARAARRRPARWRPVEGRLTVRAVHWRGVDVTLVGA